MSHKASSAPMNQLPQLDENNENCVIDIATMQIADDSNCTRIAMSTVTNHDSSNNSNNKFTYADEDSNRERNPTTNVERVECAVGDSESNNEVEMKTEIESENVQIEDEHEGGSKEQIHQHCLNELEINQVEEEQIIAELVDASTQGRCTEAKQSNRMRVAFGIILRLMLPLANSVMLSFKGIRDARFLRALKTITSSRQALTNLMAFAANTISLNLSSVQVSQRIDPILKLLKIRKTGDGVESLPDTPSIDNAPYFPISALPSPPLTPTIPGKSVSPSEQLGFSPFVRESSGAMPAFSNDKQKITAPEQPASKCCTLDVLAEPPAGQPIRADIVFIHGLHGSVVNTWKQGLWENDRQPEGFERPPKPPVRPPKRPKHSRSVLLHPPHKHKRARFTRSDTNQLLTQEEMEYEGVKDLDDGFFDATEQELGNGISYVCGVPQDIQNCDGIEYSFPTFRLRLNDNGRQLQSEFEPMHEDADGEPNINPPKVANNSSKRKNTTKLSADDPNYSKCWPADWLPLDCPGVRVIALNYTTDPYLWRPLWKKKEPRSNLIERAREMAELLIKHRVGYGQPIVWVGHSKGGLFIKQIIVDAWESGRTATAPLWRSSRGVFFYSVPHRGSHLACIKAPFLTRSVEMLDIEKNNKYLLDLHRRFAGLYHLGHIKIEVFSFIETALTLMSVLYLRIVGVDSADPGFGDVCGIRLDHREICKPRGRDCILYKELVKMIKKVC
ncbi:uncharacterized protein LOC128855424 [Anastrepha ludens]|uniref:uncharacterized protein LOC128855424 n=1 Tax=Anastrepha ludens TaxID=28586 RepID=UPI0023AFD9B9|nr:uncharacterized protein LOC128855424 [Anastrepha ludens]XP_053946281.1 uncharacterized protein LOC128855424 [Anastrepha ludens]XP_053946282.1 uncharacterized protein LOC128855424 [Anastrepha ludens]XP_053946283.1 uncharacterized protein LOC128855424 [Anastrepha ludens]XP_053946284.1 uncharacterized protein LOC128855424 [Anastrepha ludens]XP_053946285.1 uncharacterized protein LOC128855424 [Anastrepha ludens]XP_053946286.1 uncharacterized protein LOC128855424 [Anastrepha ludens]XP_05394628